MSSSPLSWTDVIRKSIHVVLVMGKVAWDSCSCECGIPFALCDTAIALVVMNSFHCFCSRNAKSNNSDSCVLEGAPPYALYSLICHLGNGQFDQQRQCFIRCVTKIGRDVTGLIDTILFGPRFIQTEHSWQSPFLQVTPIQHLLAAV